MGRIGRLAVGVYLAVAVHASDPQASTPPRPAPSPKAAVTPPIVTVRRPPALLAQIDEARPAEPLALASVKIEAEVLGFLAETSTTLTFRNELGRVLEGELVFPLPEGASISGYALDVGGELVDGVIVERQAARVAFEKEVRKGVDPGLAEWVQGNVFRTRVYPIPPHGTRTVRLKYVSQLVTRGRGAALDAFYELPLRYDREVGTLSVRVEVRKGLATPLVSAGGPAGLQFSPFEDRFVAHAELQDARLDEDLLVSLPDVPRQSVLVEQADDGECYFAIEDFPEAPSAAAPPQRSGRVAVFWDASYSREGSDRERELEALRAFLVQAGDVSLDLVVFRDQPEPPRPFVVRGGNTAALLALLRDLPLDGGTRFEPLRFTRSYDYALLFSDGLVDLGAPLPAQLDTPVFALSASGQADHALLASLAQRSGGAYFNLQRLELHEVVARLGQRPFSFLRAETASGRIDDLNPAGRRPVTGRFTLSGRLLSDDARVALRYGQGAAEQVRTHLLSRRDARPGRLVSRLWAQQRVTELALDPERNKDELLRLGRRHGIVTPGASLLVLETLAQHLEHGVEPAPSRKALPAEYLRVQQQRANESKAKEAGKLERVVAMWQARVSWWERRFEPKPLDLAKRKTGRRNGDDHGVEDGVEGGIEGGVPGGVVGGVVGGVPEAVEDARREDRDRSLGYAPRESAAGAPPPPPPPPAPRPANGKQEAPAERSSGATIVLAPWDPQTPYLAALKRAGRTGAYAAYLAERRAHGSSPAFYLDCGDALLREGERALGVRVLTTLVELRLGEPRLLRVAAHRLQQAEELDLAVELFEAVLRLRPEEPQSLRDLALALEARAEARRGKAPAAAADAQRAVELLNRVVTGEWDGRFPEIEVIALEEANRILAAFERLPGFDAARCPIDARLRQLLDVDLRIVLTWDTDQTDMDLWVIEPSGEKAYYSHALTSSGGLVSRDFTGGYGPEEYLVHRAPVGSYRIQANFYGSRAQSLTGPTTVQATVITHYGRPNERRQALTLRLKDAREVVDIGVARFEGAPAKVTP